MGMMRQGRSRSGRAGKVRPARWWVGLVAGLVAFVGVAPAATPSYAATPAAAGLPESHVPAERSTAAAPTATSFGTDCPGGAPRLRTLFTENWSGGLTSVWGDQLSMNPFRIATETIGGATNAFVRSTDVFGSAGAILRRSLGNVSPAITRLRMRARGSFPQGGVYYLIQGAIDGYGDGFVWTPSASWQTVEIDMTHWFQNQYAIRPLSLLLTHKSSTSWSPTPTGTVDLDDIDVWQCAVAPTGVWGDYHATRSAAQLYVDGNSGALMSTDYLRVGVGWGAMTWIGAAGDVDGDGRSDLLARDAAGDLWVYYGDGFASFGTRQKVGTGWGGLRCLTVLEDYTGDGRRDLVAIDPAGNLRRYWWVYPGGPLTGSQLVGVGFQGFKQLMTLGDVSGDGRWDLVGVNAAYDLVVYPSTSAGPFTGSGRRIGTGWNFRFVGSPGDVDGDGRRDLLAWDPGSARIYAYAFDSLGNYRFHWVADENVRGLVLWG